MKGKLTILVVAGTLIVAAVTAQGLGRIGATPWIHILHTLGKGVAISTTDPTDFKVVRVGIATVRILGEELRVGVMFLDTTRYKLKDIVVGNDTATGSIYSNNTQAGSFDLTLVLKGNNRIWTGSLNVNGQSYNAYILEAERRIKPVEMEERVGEFCSKYPAKCGTIARGVARERIKTYCRDNPRDPRCKALLRAYCMRNLQDIRCREVFKKYCEENPFSEACLKVEYKMTKHFCLKHPDNPRCMRIKERLRRLPTVASRIGRGETLEQAVEATEISEVKNVTTNVTQTS